MDLVESARRLNSLAYGYIGSWALLTACEHRLFDRLPAGLDGLADQYPDPYLLETWLRVLEQEGLVEEVDGVWTAPELTARLLVGPGSYADYLAGQVLGQLTARLMIGRPDTNELSRVLREPEVRTGYDGWFADPDEARRYQEAQYAGSLLPGRTIADLLEPVGPVLDVGGGWGAVAAAVARAHDVAVDVVDLEPVVASAPPAGGVRFVAGSALDPAGWPAELEYDGAILSYLLSSVPGDAHQPLLRALADRVRWVAVHDFLLDGGSLAPAWSLQHAVFVPGHRSRTIADVGEMLEAAGFGSVASRTVVDEMTVLVTATRD